MFVVIIALLIAFFMPWHAVASGTMVVASEWLFLSQAARAVQMPHGARLSPTTLARWCTRGVRGILLKHEFRGRRIVVRLCDIEAFFAEIAAKAAQPNDNHSPAPDYSKARVHNRGRTPTQRARDLARADRALASV